MLTKEQRMKIRRELFNINPFCYWCGKKMKLGAGFNGEMNLFATIDHLIPISKGGSDDTSNLVLVHKECNELRS